MKLKYLTFASLFTLSATAFAATYDPDDLKNFNETNACPKCNLSNSTITKDHQKANLEGANLSSASFYSDFTRANFAGVNASKISLSGTYSEVNFSNAILIDANLSGINLTYADFTGANLDGANLADANLLGAKITIDQLNKARSICKATLPDGSKGKCKE